MPPRYAYWTIIAGGLPTAFRASEREELLPTFQRIREKHPDAEMKWFARGKLWDSQEAARVRHDDGRGRKSFGEKRGDDKRDRADQDKRGRDWRPGGEHRDPRQKFVDAKKQQNAALRKERWERKNGPPREKPHGDPLRPAIRREPRPTGRDTWRDRPDENRGAKPEHWRDRPHEKPGAKPGDRRDRPHANPLSPESRRETRPAGRDNWRDRPRDTPGAKPEHWRDRPPRDARGPQGPPDRSARGPQGRTEWRPKPGGWKPKPGGWNRNPGIRGQDTEDPQQPPRPRGPGREPRRSDTPKPTPPPKPDEPKVPPPGPSERGHIKSRRPFRPRQGPPKDPRR